MGVSADAVFAGVSAAGLAFLAARRRGAALVGGVLLGLSLYLSYGLVLIGLLALVVLWLRHRPMAAVEAGIGAAAVAAAFTAAGFWWFDGYQLVLIRYNQGWAAERPYTYWVWANLACATLSAGLAAAPILRRAVAGLRGRSATVLLPLAAATAMVMADLSGLSKAEVERIWLPFLVWLPAGAALLPPRSHRYWLAVQAGTALTVNHLLLTAW